MTTSSISDKKLAWVERSTLLDLLNQLPLDARIAVNRATGNLIFATDRATGYIDMAEEVVESIPDRP